MKGTKAYRLRAKLTGLAQSRPVKAVTTKRILRSCSVLKGV
jgi:hypothetical protein